MNTNTVVKVMKTKMKAAVLYKPKDLKIEEVDIPEIGPGDVLAKVKVATTCGTDVKIFNRGYAESLFKYPTIFGHEWAGDIVKVGDVVTGFEEGMRVTTGGSAPCFTCSHCRKGKYNLCQNKSICIGAYAEYIKIPAQVVKFNLYEIPPNMTYEEAAIVEPLGSVIHGLKLINLDLGSTVVIIGSGPIGLLHLQLVKKLGARKAIVIDTVDERLEVAQKLGADYVVNSAHVDPIEEVKRLSNGGADVVIEAVGLRSTWEQTLKFVCPGGKVLLFGGCPPSTQIEVSADLLHYSELKILGSYDRYAHIDDKKALELISSGMIDVKSIITRKMSLDNIKEAFEILTRSKTDLKIAIMP
jgi:L-iditol 2-dehydrogenase